MERLLLRKSFAANAPIKTLTQVAKIIVVILFLIVSISLLTNNSPALVISGFGAMTAVLMLLFTDTILGFVAGIQLQQQNGGGRRLGGDAEVRRQWKCH